MYTNAWGFIVSRNSVIVIVAIVSGFLAGFAGCNSDSSNPYGTASPAPSPTTSSPGTVVMSNYGFNPYALTIQRNTTVTWKNNDPVVHTSTSDSGAWNTGDINPGQSATTKFTTAGTFTFHCTYNAATRASKEKARKNGGKPHAEGVGQ